jgi:hypothetical protein
MSIVMYVAVKQLLLLGECVWADRFNPVDVMDSSMEF